MQDRQRIINKLKAGARCFACGGFLASMDSLHRTEIYHALGYERLRRKNADVNRFYTELRSDWPQTFYLMFLRVMGGENNKEAFTELARTVPYAAVLREKLVPRNIEAMLIGASGMLDRYPHDEYILDLKRNFEYLVAKYSIAPMSCSRWRLSNIRPNNHPILRLSQAAMFLASSRDVMDRTLECRTDKDVNRLFGAETAPYWLTHYTPANASAEVAKRIGRMKTDLIGINLVVQMQFAYGSYTGNEALRMRAITLLESIAPENNYAIRGWNAYGSLAQTAFDSQALLQLTKEYCRDGRCEECPVGRRIIAKVCGGGK